MLSLTDFTHGDVRYTDFVTETELWGWKVRVDVSFEDELGKTEETLATALPAINDKLAFIEQNPDAVKQSTVSDAHLDELAGDWLYELVEDEDADEEGLMVEMEDGKMVSVDVTPDQFKASLIPLFLGFEFGENTESCQAFLELACDPDYFAGHRVHIELDEENEISCEGI